MMMTAKQKFRYVAFSTTTYTRVEDEFWRGSDHDPRLSMDVVQELIDEGWVAIEPLPEPREGHMLRYTLTGAEMRRHLVRAAAGDGTVAPSAGDEEGERERDCE
jgi:hypothetical protein